MLSKADQGNHGPCCEYRRNGVVNLFMMFEPLKARRHVKIMD